MSKIDNTTPVAWLVTGGGDYERHVFFTEVEARKMHDELTDNGWIDTCRSDEKAIVGKAQGATITFDTDQYFDGVRLPSGRYRLVRCDAPDDAKF